MGSRSDVNGGGGEGERKGEFTHACAGGCRYWRGGSSALRYRRKEGEEARYRSKENYGEKPGWVNEVKRYERSGEECFVEFIERIMNSCSFSLELFLIINTCLFLTLFFFLRRISINSSKLSRKRSPSFLVPSLINK